MASRGQPLLHPAADDTPHPEPRVIPPPPSDGPADRRPPKPIAPAFPPPTPHKPRGRIAPGPRPRGRRLPPVGRARSAHTPCGVGCPCRCAKLLPCAAEAAPLPSVEECHHVLGSGRLVAVPAGLQSGCSGREVAAPEAAGPAQGLSAGRAA